MDNNPELLRESHSSRSQNIWQNEYKAKRGLGKLTYELPSMNIFDTVTLEPQHTHPSMENTMHIHTCAYFSFIFVFVFFFLHIYKLYMLWMHTNKIQRRDQSEITYSQMLIYHKPPLMRWPSQTEDPWISVRGIDGGNDVTTLHGMNWGGSPLEVERIRSKTNK